MAGSRYHIAANRFWKVTIIFIALHLFGAVACNKCPEQKYFSVIDVFLENHQMLDFATLTSESVPANEHIGSSIFCLKLTTGVEYFSSLSEYLPSFLMSSVMACETLPPQHSENIDYLNITSNANFVIADELIFDTGESLNSLFLIEFQNGERVPLQSYLQSTESHPLEIPVFLFLNTTPQINQLHVFSVNYQLDNGNTFSASTEKVIITPE